MPLTLTAVMIAVQQLMLQSIQKTSAVMDCIA